MLDVRRLRVLQAFAREGTIAGAAQVLSYTPSAVSQQLSGLERDAGVALFRRAGRRLQLTDAGRMLVTHAADVLDRIEQAEAELAAHAGEIRGTVRIAGFQLATLALVLPALAVLRNDHPGLRVEVVGAEAETSLPLVRAGRLDLAIAEEYAHAPRPREPQLERIYLPPDDMLLVLPATHPAAAAQTPVSLPSLHDLAWATADEGTAYADMFVRLCRSVGEFEPDVRFRDNDFRVLLALAAAGHAATILPALGRPHRDDRVAVRTLTDGAFPRSIFLAVRAADRARPAIAALVDILQQVAQKQRQS
jgi:DNA-binding transcriptional LysR family regulator